MHARQYIAVHTCAQIVYRCYVRVYTDVYARMRFVHVYNMYACAYTSVHTHTPTQTPTHTENSTTSDMCRIHGGESSMRVAARK